MHNRRAIGVVFDGTFDGLLTILHGYYYDKLRPEYIEVDGAFQQALDTDYMFLDTDYDKAKQVMEGMRKKLSEETRSNIYYSFLAAEEGRFMSILLYAVLAFAKGYRVEDYKTVDYVRKVQDLAGYVGKEAHLFKGFTRFVETQNGFLYASIEPVNDVLPILAEHFSERLISERWVIQDVRRKIAAVFDGNDYVIAETTGNTDLGKVGVDERYEELWAQFLKSIAIRERKNLKLQRQLMPLRYRKHMTELQK